MFRMLIVACAALASAATAQPETAPETAPATITAAQVAEAVTPRLPHEFGADGTLTRAVAEGSLLVLTYEVTPAVALAVPAEEIARRQTAPFCASALGEAFFRSGNSLRVDVGIVGSASPARPTTVTTRCASVQPTP